MNSSGQKLLTFSVTNSANLREFMLSFILVVPVGVMSVDTYSWRKENFGRGLNWIWLFVRDINPLNDWPYSRSPRAGEQSLNLSARCVCTRVLPHQCWNVTLKLHLRLWDVKNALKQALGNLKWEKVYLRQLSVKIQLPKRSKILGFQLIDLLNCFGGCTWQSLNLVSYHCIPWLRKAVFIVLLWP